MAESTDQAARQSGAQLGPPPRADIVGSLLRPEPLLAARHRFAAGEVWGRG